jgi:hypothetical protein
MIELTDDQLAAVANGDPVRLLATDIGKEVVLLRADLFDTIKDLVDEEKKREIIARIAMKNAVARMNESP